MEEEILSFSSNGVRRSCLKFTSPSVSWKDLKLQGTLLTWGSWAVTASCVLAGLALLSLDPYFTLFTWVPWRGLPVELELEPHQSRFEQRLNITRPHNVIAAQDDRGGSETGPGTGLGDDEIEGYFIRPEQASIRGNEAANRFRAHLACFSETGEWVYDSKPRKLPWMVRDFNLRRSFNVCDIVHEKQNGGIFGMKADNIALQRGPDKAGNWSVREELKWVWQTDNSKCPWHRMNRDDFCRQIGSNRNVLVVGDSLNQLIYYSIENALVTNHSSEIKRSILEGDELCADVLGGDGMGFRVDFVRNDYLSLLSEELPGNQKILNRQDPWMPVLQKGNPDYKILLLNRGAHFMNDENLSKGLRTTFTFLRRRFPHLLVIYRNTISGHVNCSNYHSPLHTPPKGSASRFHWGEFDRQNQIAKSIVEEFNYMYVDVARAVGMRPEGHLSPTDCLHYCMPGPLDFAVEMIYNIFRLL